MAGDNEEMFMTRSLNVMPKTTEQHLIVCNQIMEPQSLPLAPQVLGPVASVIGLGLGSQVIVNITAHTFPSP